MAKKKIKMFTTPVGEIALGFIQNVAPKHSDKQEPGFVVKLAFDGTEDGFDEFKDWWAKLSKKAHAKIIEENPKKKRFKPHVVFAPEIDDNGDETGRVLFTATQTAKWPSGDKRSIPIFDENSLPWDPEVKIGNGSKASLSFSLGQPYFFDSKEITGVKPFLQAVMIEELVEYKGEGQKAESFGFAKATSAPAIDDDIFDGGDDGGDVNPDF